MKFFCTRSLACPGGDEVDGVAELFELGDEVFASSFGLVFAGEVVGAEFLVGATVGE